MNMPGILWPYMFHTGMDVLLERHAHKLKGRRVALLAHPASINSMSVHSAILLSDHPDVNLKCLFGPEHGFYGFRGAGESVTNEVHPSWHIPIYSLYGDTCRPTPEILEGLDMIITDLQDIGVRCYTYGSTLRYLLEAAEKAGISVMVTDRPIPFPDTIDGPALNSLFESFVGCLPAPMVYGMTPGETALWLVNKLDLSLDLEVIPMKGYHREPVRKAVWPEWVPPSPAIRSWESAWCYPATVFAEALPVLDCLRKTPQAFRMLTAPGVDGRELSAAMSDLELSGVYFEPCRDGQRPDREGIHIHVSNPSVFKPVLTGISILSVISNLYGDDFLWRHRGTREEFFDQLSGTDRVRTALRSDTPADDIAAEWKSDHETYLDSRKDALLYEPT